MRTWAAWALVFFLLAAMMAALVAPWPVAAGMAVGGVLAMRLGQRVFVTASVISGAVYALVLAWLDPGPTGVIIAGQRIGMEGAVTGAVGVLRLSAIIAINLAAVQWVSPARWIDALRLPRGATAFVAAVLVASKELSDDQRRRIQVLRWNGQWPAGRRARLQAAASMVPGMLISAYHRGAARREALRMAGVGTGPRFAPLVAITALAVAGRLVLAGVPNVSLVYVVVFAGGVVSGARVGATAGAISMLLTDLLLTGLAPVPFVNVPAMALVGAAGGMFRNAASHDMTVVTLWAATLGIVSTFAFSVVSDTLEWLIVPEFRGNLDFLRVRILAGLAFNAIPAAANAVLFGAVVGPVARAFAAYRDASDKATTTSAVTQAVASDDGV